MHKLKLHNVSPSKRETSFGMRANIKQFGIPVLLWHVVVCLHYISVSNQQQMCSAFMWDVCMQHAFSIHRQIVAWPNTIWSQRYHLKVVGCVHDQEQQPVANTCTIYIDRTNTFEDEKTEPVLGPRLEGRWNNLSLTRTVAIEYGITLYLPPITSRTTAKYNP